MTASPSSRARSVAGRSDTLRNDTDRRDADRGSAPDEAHGVAVPGAHRARTVVFAPDAFKGSASAPEAAAALAAGWRSERPGDELVLLPMADGGEGTLDAIGAAVPESERVPLRVVGPDGRKASASWLRLPDGSAVVELAECSGILLPPVSPVTGRPEFDGLAAHSFGTGQAILAAIAGGATRVQVALGGSASSDGGAGLLRALGARLLDRDGREIGGGVPGVGNAALAEVSRVDLDGLVTLPPGGLVAWTDVRSPLLGARGAVAVFGPQKGIGPELAPVAEANLAGFARALGGDPETPGAGAAGGAGFGLHAIGATIESGADAVARAIGLDPAVRRADVVVAGEGSFDAQTAEGKAVARVLEAVAGGSGDAVLVAGRIAAETRGFARALALGELVRDGEDSFRDAAVLLRRAGREIARGLA